MNPLEQHDRLQSRRQFLSSTAMGLGASAAIEAALGIEAMRQGLLLPTVNHIPDPELADIDVVPNRTRRYSYEFFLSNTFGFGGHNTSAVFRKFKD